MIHYLTPEEQDIIDPTGRGRTFLKGMQDSAPTPIPALFATRSREAWKAEFCALRAKIYGQSQRYAFEQAYDEKHDDKYGGQGDRFSLNELRKKYDKSYEYAKRPIALAPELYAARDFLLTRIKYAKETNGGILYPTGIGTVGTLGGLPTLMRKGTFYAETIGHKNWRHALHDLPGERSQRLKHRGINVDANQNVRELEKPLTAVRNWLKRQFPEYFSAWLNPREELNPRILNALRQRACAVEFDYDDCDDTFSWEIAAFLLPIYEALLSEGEYWHFAAMIEELFYQPIFFGEFEYVGKHNLLSGQAITNDFETLFDVICVLAACMVAGISFSKILLLAALGDDVLVLLQPEAGIAEKFYEAYIAMASSAGMVISDAKSGYRYTQQCTFCRRAYSLRQRATLNSAGIEYIGGFYPSILTLNNTINPEYHSATVAETIVSTCARMDNLFGSPMFTPTVQFVFARRKRTIEIPSRAELQVVTYREGGGR